MSSQFRLDLALYFFKVRYIDYLNATASFIGIEKKNAKCIFFLRAWLAVLYKVIYNVIGQILVRTYVEE